MATKRFDLIVIGGGSGGIATADKAASYGAKVALIEKEDLGGTCVNRGCVPKKIMWFGGQLINSMNFAPDYGLHIEKEKFNFAELVRHRNHYIKILDGNLRKKLTKNHVTYLKGDAKFTDANTIILKGQRYTARHFVIATGCHPNRPDIKGAKYGITSDGFFQLTRLPKKIAVIGGGYIAVELGCILNQLGSQVQLIIRKNKLLKNFDASLGAALMKTMTAHGIEIIKRHEAAEISRDAKGRLTIHCKNKSKLSGYDAVLFAIGRSACIADLNSAAAGVKTNKEGFIATNKWENTNVKHIYAIGDVTGKRMLTPVAVAAGRKLAARVFGKEKNVYLDYENIPTVIFSHPPIGSVGLSEAAAIKKYGRNKLTIYQETFESLYFALGKKKVPSTVKLIALKKSQKIIGCHIIDPQAAEILQGFALAIKMGATKQDFDKVVAIHPTSAEELVLLKSKNIIK